MTPLKTAILVSAILIATGISGTQPECHASERVQRIARAAWKQIVRAQVQKVVGKNHLQAGLSIVRGAAWHPAVNGHLSSVASVDPVRSSADKLVTKDVKGFQRTLEFYDHFEEYNIFGTVVLQTTARNASHHKYVNTSPGNPFHEIYEFLSRERPPELMQHLFGDALPSWRANAKVQYCVRGNVCTFWTPQPTADAPFFKRSVPTAEVKAFLQSSGAPGLPGWQFLMAPRSQESMLGMD